MMRSLFFNRSPRISSAVKQHEKKNACKCAPQRVPYADMSLTQKIDLVRKEIATLETGRIALDASRYDVLEELYVCLADLKIRHQAQKGDPLVDFCLEHPDADECRMYDV